MRLAPVLSSSDLPSAELQAARLDGELYAVDGCFSPIDQIERRELRAGSLAARLHPRLIGEQRTAAWVHGALLDPPRRHELCADIAARVRPVDTTGIVVREVVLEPGDLVECAGMRLTGPLRTMIDIARFSDVFEAEERSILRQLAAMYDINLDQCIAMLERRRNLPGKRTALKRISTALV